MAGCGRYRAEKVSPRQGLSRGATLLVDCVEFVVEGPLVSEVMSATDLIINTCKSLRYRGFRSVRECGLVCLSMYRQDRIIFSGCFVVAGQLNGIRLRLLRGNVFIHNTASGLKQLFTEVLIETLYRYATVLHYSFEMFKIFKTSA